MSARILIIEDNPDNLELMTYLLKAFGHVALVARCGSEAMDIARLLRPEIILSDIQLPSLDGFGVARQFKANASTRGIPLVAVTALAMVGDRDKALEAGFDGYISKPIDPESFVCQVEEFLDADSRTILPMPEAAAADKPWAPPAQPGNVIRLLEPDAPAAQRDARLRRNRER